MLQVRNNTAYGNGGGIAADCSIVELNDVVMLGNSAPGANGGALSLGSTISYTGLQVVKYRS